MSAQMHYRKDEDFVPFDAVYNTIGEAVYKTSPDIFFHNRPCSRIFQNVLDDGMHLNRKIIAEASLIIFIVLNSPDKLSFRFGVK